MKKYISQLELKKLLHYNPETGIFTWLVKPNRKIRIKSVAGTSDKDGYVLIGVNKIRYRAHRLAFLYMEGYFPENEIEHIDRIRNNNKWDNIKETSRSCNMKNCNVQKRNISGITGVIWVEKLQKWRVSVHNNGTIINLGHFFSKLEAAKVRYKAELKYDYPNCQLESSAKIYIENKKQC